MDTSTSPTVDRIQSAATEVHDVLGSGCSEATYHRALEHEFSSRNIPFSSETTIPIFYKDVPVGTRRPDMIVTDGDDSVAVELKAGSDRGEEQLQNYISIFENDNNFDISTGVLIQFNDELNMMVSE